MHLRRVCRIALTAGLLVVTACGSHPTIRATGRSDVTRNVVRRPIRQVDHPDVKGALTAISHVIEVMFPPPTVPAVTAPHSAAQTIVTPPAYPPSFQPCGGAYPPCWRVATESGGDYGAFNPGGCNGDGCYGKWQFSGEWACKLGLPCDLSTATPAQQDEAARILWNGGAGCANWSACT